MVQSILAFGISVAGSNSRTSDDISVCRSVLCFLLIVATSFVDLNSSPRTSDETPTVISDVCLMRMFTDCLRIRPKAASSPC